MGHGLPPVVLPGHGDAEHVLQLRGADGDAGSRAEGCHHAVRHEVDDEAEADEAQEDGDAARDQGQERGALHPILGRDVAEAVQGLAAEEAHERRGARLHLPDGAQARVDHERQEGGVEPRLHRQAGEHREGQALGHEHEAHRKARDGVALEGVGQGAGARDVRLGGLAQEEARVDWEPGQGWYEVGQLELALLVVHEPEVHVVVAVGVIVGVVRGRARRPGLVGGLPEVPGRLRVNAQDHTIGARHVVALVGRRLPDRHLGFAFGLALVAPRPPREAERHALAGAEHRGWGPRQSWAEEPAARERREAAAALAETLPTSGCA
mmetsp:Transcript_37674/g.116167  ORF Transcript_37674/g.116167 Transcript_37674/m.116167 type:complete len:323 (+) Transcript_37674:1510-2478(+)